MIKKTWRITGVVVDVNNPSIPLAGLGVEVLEEDAYSVERLSSPSRETEARYGSDLLGYAVSDSQGRFEFAFGEEDFVDSSEPDSPKVYFKVYDSDNKLLKRTVDAPISLNPGTPERTNITIAVDLQGTITTRAHSVSGTVLFSTRHPAENYTIEAYDQQLDVQTNQFTEVSLGTVVAKSDGTYRIIFESTELGTEKELADLFVKVYDANNATVAVSKLITNAPIHTQVDLIVQAAAEAEITEFDYVSQLCSDVLATDINAITRHQIGYYANRSQLYERQVDFRIQAEILARKVVRPSVPAEVFYGLFRQKMPTDIALLAGQERTALREALEFSIKEQVIATPAEPLDTLIDIIKAHTSRELVASSPRIEFVRGLMVLSGLDMSEQETFVNRFLDNDKENPGFWEDVAADIGQVKADQLRLSTELSVLSSNHKPLVDVLFADPAITKIEDTVTLDRTAWEAAVGTLVPEEFADKNEYVDFLIRSTEDSFPYPFFRAEMNRGTTTTFGEFGPFADAHDPSGFNLATINISKFVEDESINLSAQQEKDIFGIQGLFRIAPRAGRCDVAKTLWDSGVNSVFDIALMGKSSFSNKFDSTLEPELVGKLYRKAVNTVTEAIFIGMTNLSESIPMNVTPDPGSGLGGGIPEYDTLFGKVDNCEIDHFKSVFGPAAYLVDCLEYLRRTEDSDGYGNGFEKLALRRPDIAGTTTGGIPNEDGVKLSIENTGNAMPYIDLVNEVFERAVALSDSTIADPTFVPQTTADSEDLKAEPQYTHHPVYEAFAQLKYPWTFDLYREEAAAYVAMLGCERHEIMRSFLSASGAPSELDVVSELLGITSVERSELGNQTPDVGEYFSLNSTTFVLSSVEHISDLLDAAQLSYAQLLEILETNYVNPDAKAIEYDVFAPCSLENAKLYDLGTTGNDILFENVLVRLYRFQILQRKSGWSAGDLDGLLSVIGVNNAYLTGPQLLDIGRAKKLEEQLEIGISELVCWWNQANSRQSILEKTGLSEDEYDLWRTLFGFSTSVPPTPSETETFFDQFEKLDDAGYTIDQVSYLVGEKTDDEFGDYPNENEIAEFLKELREKIAEEKATYDPSVDQAILLEQKLDSTYTDAEIYEKGDLVSISLEIVNQTSGHTTEQKTFVQKYFSLFTDGEDAVVKLINGTLTDVAARIEYVLTAILDNFIAGQLATKFIVPTAAMRELILHHLNINSMSAIDYLKSDDFAHRDPSVASKTEIVFADFNPFFSTLFKIGIVATTVEASFEFVKTVPDELTTFPNTVENLLKLISVNELDQKIRTPLGGLFEVLDTELVPDKVTLLSDITGWQTSGIEFLAGLFTEDWEDYRLIEKISGVHEYMSITNATAAEHWSISGLAVNMALAEGIKAYVRGQLEDKDWYEQAPDARESIRKGQRDILQAYLLASSSAGDFADINDLYDHFLIDSEMEPCFLTSRLKLAISSTQLFIQRSLMGLEEGIEFSRDLKEEWKWRKNYRVWEANRKVFLYPENWIEPELRDDKTPFFKELEDELLQNAVTEDNVERAFLNYLYKLDEVSNLEVVGFYKEYERDSAETETTFTKAKYQNYEYVSESTLHVIGRTRTNPHIYYYRRREDDAWTHWEKIDLDIISDHVLPVVYNRRLYLFWPTLSPQEPEGEYDKGKSELSMNWSSYRNGIWDPPTVSVGTHKDIYSYDFSFNHFKIFINDTTNDLTILRFETVKYFLDTEPFINQLGYGIWNNILSAADQVVEGLTEFSDFLSNAKVLDGFHFNRQTGALIPMRVHLSGNMPISQMFEV